MQNIIQKIKDHMKRVDTYSYRGWLLSDRFSKRLFAFMGYTALALIGIELIRIILVNIIVAVQYGL